MLGFFLLLISVASVFGVCPKTMYKWHFPETAGDMLIVYGIRFKSEVPNNVPFEVYVHNAGKKQLCIKVEAGELIPQGGWIEANCAAGKLEGNYVSSTGSGLRFCGDKIWLRGQYKPNPTKAPESKLTKAPEPKAPEPKAPEPKLTKAPEPKPTEAPVPKLTKAPEAKQSVPLGNLARGKPTFQSGIQSDSRPSRAVDGDRNPDARQYSCTHTLMMNNPFWAVDLGESYPVKSVSITNRGDCCATRLKNYDIVVTDTEPSNNDHPLYSSADVCIHRGSSHTGTLSLECTKELKGRYVFIVLKYREHLTLCEVEVFGTVQEIPSGNVARGKHTWQTGTKHHGVSSRAVDGNSASHWNHNSCMHTDERDNPYWAVDLGKSYHVTGVSILNRSDCCAHFLNNYDVVVMNTKPSNDEPPYGPADVCIHRSAFHHGELMMKCTGYVRGRYVMVRLSHRGVMTFCELKVHV